MVLSNFNIVCVTCLLYLNIFNIYVSFYFINESIGFYPSFVLNIGNLIDMYSYNWKKIVFLWNYFIHPEKEVQNWMAN